MRTLPRLRLLPSGGRTFGFQFRLRSKTKTSQMRSKPARSSSACSKLRPGRSSMTPSFDAKAACRGASCG
ncbi:MAG: hypothetical protein V8T86_09190 [Victivallis sp.]